MKARLLSSRWTRLRTWWRVRGRRGLLLAAAGLFMIVAGLANAASDHGLLNTLAHRGVTADAVVTHVSYTNGVLDTVVVRFTVDERPLSAELSIIDTVPSSLSKNDHVRVAYDPLDPSQVLLTTQLNNGHITVDYIVAGLGGAAVVAGLGWWAVRRRGPARRIALHTLAPGTEGESNA